MEFGLRQIILIDSYVAGVASELDVSGHTNISGGNGKGKTTFLRLVPIFYGESPRRLVTASGNGNTSFNEWYLPRTGSYLVFEYMSNGEPKMVVFCNRANETRHRHVFIDSAYREDLFLDADSATIYPAHSLLTRLSAANLSHLNVDTTQGYRQILLDGTVPKAYHFSMCPRNSRMSQLTPLFTGMFKRDAQFADLSRVIQEYAMDKLDDDSRKILRGFSPHRDHLTATLTQYDAYQALEAIKPKCDTLQSQLEDHQVAKRKLSASVVAAKSVHSDLGLAIRGYGEEILTIQRQMSEQETAFRNEATRLAGLIEVVDQQLGPNVTEKHRIEREYQAYQDSNLPQWKDKLESLADLKEELEGLDTQYAVLSNASTEIRKPIDAEIARLKDQAGKTIRELGNKRDRAVRDYQTKRNALTASQLSEVYAQGQTHRRESDDQKTLVNRLSSEALVLEERLNHPQPDPKLARQLDIAQSNHETAQTAFEEAQTENTDAQSALKKAQSAYDTVDARFEKARNLADRTEESLLEVQGLISGDEHTLIHFLNEQRPGWEDTLGRILQPDILRRKNLAPTIDPEHAGAQNLFGVLIDTSKLPEQELTPAALATSLAELEESLTAAEKDCADAERDLNKEYGQREGAKTREINADNAFKQARNKLHSESAMLRQIRQQVDVSVADNRKTIETALTKARNEHSEAETQLQVLGERQEAAVAKLSEDQRSTLKDFDDDHEASVKAISESITAAEDTLDSEVVRLNRQIDQALSDEGINPEELQALQAQRKTLKESIDEVLSKQALVRGYQAFMADDYAQLEDIESAVTKLRADKAWHESDKSALSTRWKLAGDGLSATIKELEQHQATDAANRDTLEIRILNVEQDRALMVREDDSSLMLYREMSPPKLTDEYVKWVREEATLLSSLKKLSDEFAIVFERHSGTPSTQYWQESELDWDGTDERVITRAQAVIDYYHGGKHAIVFESLVKGFGNLDQIDIYRRAMENFDKRIRRFNRELSQHIAQSLDFKGLSNIEPTVSFDLEELDYWKDIRSLADGVRAWRDEAGINSMPDEDLVRSLRNYLDTFEVSRANVAVDELWRLIRFRFTVIENGKLKTVTGNRDLSGEASVSSNGLSYLVLIVVFLGFVDMQRNKQPVHLTWALDELRAFDNDNKRALLELLARHNISLVTACPDMEDRDLGIFHRVYQLEDFNNGRRFVRWNMPPVRQASATNPFLEDVE
jgi:hypothetical protein